VPIRYKAVRAGAGAALAEPREEEAGNVLARTGARASAPAKAGVLLPSSPANGAVLGRRCRQAQRSFLQRIVAVTARPAAIKRGKLREIRP
jgi:hypothetical protein